MRNDRTLELRCNYFERIQISRGFGPDLTPDRYRNKSDKISENVPSLPFFLLSSKGLRAISQRAAISRWQN